MALTMERKSRCGVVVSRSVVDSPVEATDCCHLSHGEVKVRVALVAEDAVHCAVVCHPLWFVVFLQGADGGLCVLVHIVRGGRADLQHLELYL